VAAVPGVLRAEPFTAWESSGDIWAREEATGRVWNLTADWPWAASHPDVAAYTVVFETGGPSFPAIYAYAFDHRFLRDEFPVYIAVSGSGVSDPKVGVVDPSGLGD
jgi:hypothetical protein